MSLTLDDFAHAWGTDKRSGKHNYAVHYDHHFASLRHKPISLLETGVWKGQSLGMWAGYFDNMDATIRGIDIDLTQYEEVIDPRVKVWQGNMATWVARKPYDIIVDDGSHKWSDQVLFFNNNWQAVKPGGYYCIEDLNTSFPDRWGVQFADQMTSGTMLVKGLIDRLNLYGYPTHVHEVPEHKRVYPLDISEMHLYPYLAIIRKVSEADFYRPREEE